MLRRGTFQRWQVRSARLWRNRSGIAAMEFGLAAPVLLVMGCFGTEIAYEASVNMLMSQIALSAADNASRLAQTNNSAVTPTVTNSEVGVVLNGVIRQGAAYGLQANGRVILSSLERDPVTGKQWIHWQRCIGNVTTVRSAYGVQNAKFDNGIGKGTTKAVAGTGQAVMFVEVVYNYQRLFGTMFLPPVQFIHEAAFLTRDARNLTAGLSGTASNTC